MNRQDLIDILKVDGVEKQIEEAIEQKELTQEEKDSIYSFLRTNDREEAKNIFQNILNDIEKTPSASNVREEAQEWERIRKEVAQEIANCKEQQLQTIEAIGNYDTIISSVADSNLHKQLESASALVMDEQKKKYDELDMITKRSDALTLMHIESKSMQAQARGRQYIEATMPFRSSIRAAWEGLNERVQGITHVIANEVRAHKTALKTMDLNDVSIKEAISNKINLISAKASLKEYNKQSKAIEKAEAKLIKRATKLAPNRQENPFLNAIKDFQKLGDKAPKVDLTYKEAIEILQKSDKAQDVKLLEKQAKIIDKSSKFLIDAQVRVDSALARVSNNLDKRRENIEVARDNIARDVREGRLGGSRGVQENIAKNLSEAYDKTFLSKGFNDDLKKYMQEHGFNHMLDKDLRIPMEHQELKQVQEVQAQAQEQEQERQSFEDMDLDNNPFQKDYDNGTLGDIYQEDFQVTNNFNPNNYQDFDPTSSGFAYDDLDTRDMDCPICDTSYDTNYDEQEFEFER